MIHLIAAVGRSGQLGLNNKLPWHDPEDLRWFKKMTMGQVLVVGHNTAQTLPPLPGRRVYVAKRGEDPRDTIEFMADQGVADLWIAGGAKTYQQWLPFIDRFHINRVDYDGLADTWMPMLFAAPRWTPVSMELPKPYEDVFVLLHDGTSHIGRLNHLGTWLRASYQRNKNQYGFDPGSVKAWQRPQR